MLTPEPSPRLNPVFDNTSRAAALLVIFVALLALAGWTFGVPLLARAHATWTPMNPMTAVCFVLCGTALLALTGYLYSVLALYQVRGHLPMAVNTASCFMLLCVGVLTARPDREPLATVLSATAGGVVARRLLPSALLIPLLVGLLALKGERNDLYELPFMMTLFTLTNVVIFVALIWWNASSLRRLDEQRKQME